MGRAFSASSRTVRMTTWSKVFGSWTFRHTRTPGHFDFLANRFLSCMLPQSPPILSASALTLGKGLVYEFRVGWELNSGLRILQCGAVSLATRPGSRRHGQEAAHVHCRAAAICSELKQLNLYRVSHLASLALPTPTAVNHSPSRFVRTAATAPADRQERRAPMPSWLYFAWA